jgi:hypothetical protein
MKVVCLLLILPLWSVYSEAQTSYIEVAVSDTVIVAADQFVFHLMVMPDAMYMESDTVPAGRPVNYMLREKEIRQRQKKAIDAYEAWLKAAGFTASPLNIPDMMSSRGYGNYFLTYHITSVEELKRFQNILKEEPSINAVLQSATSRQEEDHQKRLLSKLMDKARSKATYIAALSGKKISDIESVSDNVTNERTSWNPYLSSTPVTRAPADSNPTQINISYPITGKLVVRFSWN